MGHLTGKVAIVTGSGANIGEACVRALAKAGALVVLADINIIGAERVAEEINSAGGTAFAQHTDLAEEGSIQAIIDRSEEHTSALQSLMRISYAVSCLKKQKQ